jgi:hypothetical protein
MLKSLDVLIGFSVVMLVGSFAATLLTHAFTSIVNMRGGQLLRGLSDLLQHIDPSLDRKVVEEISTTILKNPLISEVSTRLGPVISREEFTTLLLSFAAGEERKTLTDAARSALQNMLEKNGVRDPAKTLGNIRDLALRIEQANPGIPNNVRSNLAILREAPSALTAKIHGWFDQTIDRVSLRFTANTRIVTFVAALLIAVITQMDAIGLVNRLYSDPALRKSLVEEAMKNVPATSSPDANQGAIAEVDAALAKSGVLSISGWKDFSGQRLIGILLSAALLSLGAPFWYDMLKNVIKLRSTLAQKDDQQRAERQNTSPNDAVSTTPATAAITAATVPTTVLPGEQGFLDAVG